jgi:hypothetical protein
MISSIYLPLIQTFLALYILNHFVPQNFKQILDSRKRLLELYQSLLLIKSHVIYNRYDIEHLTHFNPNIDKFIYDLIILFLKISNGS